MLLQILKVVDRKIILTMWIFSKINGRHLSGDLRPFLFQKDTRLTEG